MYIVIIKFKNHDIIKQYRACTRTLKKANNIIKKFSKQKDVIILGSLIQEVRV